MSKYHTLFLSLTLMLLSSFASACSSRTGLTQAPQEAFPSASMKSMEFSQDISTTSAKKWKLWISPGVPQKLRNQITAIPDFLISHHTEEAEVRLLPVRKDDNTGMYQTVWVYALVAPFPTVMDGVSQKELTSAWQGRTSGEMQGHPLLVSAATLETFQALWGNPAPGAVRVLSPEVILAEAWKKQPSWAIIPFEELEARWKVLHVDGLSPLDKTMAAESYPLAIWYALEGDTEVLGRLERGGVPPLAGNRDPERMTTLIMTGTTALVRSTALRMEEKGIDYPARDIGTLLRSADLTHISNEVPFYSDCPPAKPLRGEARFCSDPRYLGLLEAIGADLIELTGNHILDWGTGAFEETLTLYRENGFRFYGGGEDKEDAQKPLVVEDHGNRLVFIGCNAVGPENILATDTQAGAAPCDFNKMAQEIVQYKAQGILPIVTFQHYELDDFRPQSAHRLDSKAMAQAGAVIVSGSQAHHAQCMIFDEGRFIHYGLGNLFFDQMMKENRPACIDRHVFYGGRYISTELLTVELEDYARPRLMNAQERQAFLKEVFEVCKADVAYSQ
ncbi:MAG: CapA family protein [Anaerolineaceae bacterium]|nr:CapA family protein [Anaerolineaceae bacterium]